MRKFTSLVIIWLVMTYSTSNLWAETKETNFCNDAYQISYNAVLGKTILLRRISNDPSRYQPVDNNYDGVADCPDPVFGVHPSDPAIPGWEERESKVKNSSPKGVSLATQNVDDVRVLFRNIAQRIKLRLVQ